jgi:hypothetical protein
VPEPFFSIPLILLVLFFSFQLQINAQQQVIHQTLQNLPPLFLSKSTQQTGALEKSIVIFIV